MYCAKRSSRGVTQCRQHLLPVAREARQIFPAASAIHPHPMRRTAGRSASRLQWQARRRLPPRVHTTLMIRIKGSRVRPPLFFAVPQGTENYAVPSADLPHRVRPRSFTFILKRSLAHTRDRSFIFEPPCFARARHPSDIHIGHAQCSCSCASTLRVCHFESIGSSSHRLFLPRSSFFCESRRASNIVSARATASVRALSRSSHENVRRSKAWTRSSWSKSNAPMLI